LYCNLDQFGKYVSSIRKKLGFNRELLAELSLVSVSTIKKIETGKHLPSHLILEDLSNILKVDLNRVILDYRVENFDQFEKIVNRVECKSDAHEYSTLQEEYHAFEDLLNLTQNTYYKRLIQQFMFLIESILLKEEKNYEGSFHKLILAMKVFTPNFNIRHYKNFVYNDMEVRILMNISILFKQLKSKEKFLEIMVFLIEAVEKTSELYPKICHNLSNAYNLLGDYKNSLKYADMGIQYCTENRKLNGINLLYFSKGVAEYALGDSSYPESLNKAISFCDILGQRELKEIIIYKCNKFYNLYI